MDRTPALNGPAIDQATLDAAVELARSAGELTLRWFRCEGLAVQRKSDGTPVTAADREAERYLRERITERFPGDGVLGEEEAPTPSATGRRWIIDPIDGTKAFTCGVPLYASLLALEDEHGIAAGVVVLPALREAVWAGRGRGAWCDRGRARVNDQVTLEGAYVMTSSIAPFRPAQLAALSSAGATLRTWGDGYGYALVATGRVAAMVDPAVEAYDIGPMPVLLAEAGGRFSDLQGRAGIDGGSGVGSNGAVHDELLAVLSRQRSGPRLRAGGAIGADAPSERR